MTETEFQKAVREVQETAYDEGFELPMPAEEIVRLEQEGHIVDLRTGQQTLDVADKPIDFVPGL